MIARHSQKGTRIPYFSILSALKLSEFHSEIYFFSIFCLSLLLSMLCGMITILVEFILIQIGFLTSQLSLQSYILKKLFHVSFKGREHFKVESLSVYFDTGPCYVILNDIGNFYHTPVLRFHWESSLLNHANIIVIDSEINPFSSTFSIIKS